MSSLIEEALTLKPVERLQLVDELLLSLELPSKEVDDAWKKEAENRLLAFKNGTLKAVSKEEVFAKYKK